jgi:Tfp pilus assembly protein PilX
VDSNRVLKCSRCGFALIVTILLMVLLTVVAVGLLTLAAVSLRVTAQEEAMVAARANARLGLLLAFAELQHSVGPDARMTARAATLGKDPRAGGSGFPIPTASPNSDPQIATSSGSSRA